MLRFMTSLALCAAAASAAAQTTVALDLVDATGATRAVGTVALAAPELGGLSDVIVSIKLSAQDQALAIGHADGPKLGLLHLPYALAEDI